MGCAEWRWWVAQWESCLHAPDHSVRSEHVTLGPACSQLPGCVSGKECSYGMGVAGTFIRLFVKVLWHDWCPILLCSGTVCVRRDCVSVPWISGKVSWEAVWLWQLFTFIWWRVFVVCFTGSQGYQATHSGSLPPGGWVSTASLISSTLTGRYPDRDYSSPHLLPLCAHFSIGLCVLPLSVPKSQACQELLFPNIYIF